MRLNNLKRIKDGNGILKIKNKDEV